MKIIRHFSRAARYALVSSLIATALALSVIRFWLLPKAALFREELQSRIGAMIGETVRIHGLSARMRGLDPDLVLKGFEIADAAGRRTPLRFAQVRMQVSLIDSLLARRPIVHGIRLVGASITVQREQDGTIAVLGLKPSEHLPAWLFAEGTVELRDIDLEWRDLRAGAAPLVLGRSTIRLHNEADRHRLNASFALGAISNDSLRLAADFQGIRLDTAAWRGRFYVDGSGIGAGVLGDPLPVPIKLKSGAASFRLWGDWQDGAVKQLVGRIDLAGASISLEGEGGERRGDLHRLGGTLHWHREAGGWRLDVRRFQLSLLRQAWPETQFAIAVDHDAAGHLKTVRAATSYLRFDDLHELFDALPELDAGHREALQGFSPRGEAHDLRLVYGPGAPLGERWALCGALSELDLNAWQGMPGLSHFSGQVCGNDRQGRILLRTEHAELNFDRLLNKPARLERLEGALDWRQSEEEWRIAASGLDLAAPGLEARGRIEYRRPKADGASPFLSLRVHLAHLDAALLRDYLPLKAMPEAPAAWLQGAFAAGRVKAADVLFHGAMADFPFTRGEGVFEVLVDAQGLDVQYEPEWPRLSGVDASIRLYGPALFIETSGGRIGEVQLRTGHAEALDWLHGHWLTVSGEGEASVPDSLKLLQQTPLRYIPERLLKVVNPAGETVIALNLRIPLASGVGRVAVDGSARLERAALTVAGLNLNVQGIAGTVHFTEGGFDAKNLKATTLGGSVAIDVAQKGDDILIDAAGRAGVPLLQKTFSARLWSYLKGVLDYRLSLRLPESMNRAGDPMRMIVRSDLVGLGVLLPAPLGKTEPTRKDLRAELVMRSGSRTSMRLLYGDTVQARLTLSEPASGFELENGDLALGKPLPPASHEPGLGVYASLNELDVKPWQELVSAGGAGEPRGLALRVLDLDVADLRWNQGDFGHLALVGRLNQGEWTGTLDGAWGKGRFSAATPEVGRSDVKLDLDYLRLPKFSLAKPERAHATPPDPATIPALQISSKQTLWRERNIGALALETERWTQGMNIKKLTVQRRPNHQLTLTGSWMRVDGRDETKAKGHANIADLGKFLTQLGFAGEIGDTPTVVDVSLAWPGAPYQFSAANVGGDVKMKLGRGAILKMEPGMGRALGVLNLHTLRRLLLLDFSDLFGQGLAYDSMEGRFHLGHGQAQTDGFAIDAVAAKILISGHVGLVARDFDETVTVIPHALASLPIAGALIGGSAVDAAITVAEKLFGKERASIGSTNYAVKGSWDDPEITRIGGYMPLDMLQRAWSEVKDFSGFGTNGDTDE